MDTLKFFSEKLKKYKDGPMAVSWGSKESQELRFKILCEIGCLKNKTILDYGCGLGDLFKFLQPYKIRGYVGYDINQDMIDGALKKYPNGIFRSYLIARKFDYVISSGIFNLQEKNWEKITYQTINEMFLISKFGVAVNFLSSLAKKKNNLSYYANPLSILRFISTITDKFVLRHDYKSNDFTIYLYH